MTIEELVVQAQQGDGGAMESVCQQFTGLVEKAARRSHVRIFYDDAAAVARLGLVEAIQTYRKDMGVPFAGYAKSKVDFSVWNLFKRERRRWQAEQSLDKESESISLGGGAFEDQVSNRLAVAAIMAAVNQLPPKQRKVMSCMLSLGKSLTETANLLGITPQAASNLRQRAVKVLRQYKEFGDESGILKK